MATDPSVTVLMSVHNGQRHLEEAMDSILRQTFSDFEFVVIDDGSDDETWSILSAYAASDKRIVLLRNRKNIGLTRSLGIGLGIARGNHVARQDADDVSFPRRLARQIKYLIGNPDVGLIGTWADVVDENGRWIGSWEPAARPSVIKWLLLFGNCFIHSTVMMRRSALMEVGAYSSSVKYAQDYDLWSRMSFEFQLANLPEALACARVWPDRITNRFSYAQDETASQVSLRAISRTLGEPVASDLGKDLHRTSLGLALEDSRPIYALSQLICKLHRTYSRSEPLNASDATMVTRDAASRLYLLAGQNLRVSPLASMYAAYRGARFDLRCPSMETIRLLLYRLRRGDEPEAHQLSNNFDEETSNVPKLPANLPDGNHS
jgi:glycosyltransferase involved in cell wall biosynthesis